MRSLFPLALLTAAVTTALSSPLTQLPFLRPTSPSSPSLLNDEGDLFIHQAHRVNLQLGVMSRCPDAHLCEAVFERVLETGVEVQFDVEGEGKEEGEDAKETRREKRRVEVRELVDLSTVYIARENTTSSEYGVTCMHGPLECRGNVQQLCARRYWVELEEEEEEGEVGGGDEVGEVGEVEGRRREKQKWEDWWNFIQCLNYGETSSIGTEHKAKECAKVVGREWTPSLSRCASPSPSFDPGHSEGAQLLLASLHEAERLKVTKSCTVLIGGRKVCIHDGTWQSCPSGHSPADFARQIAEEWERLNNNGGGGGKKADEEEE